MKEILRIVKLNFKKENNPRLKDYELHHLKSFKMFLIKHKENNYPAMKS